MKAKLLKKLRNIGREMINVHSITKENGISTGMTYGFDYDEYRDLFELGDTEEDVKGKAARVYIKTNINEICKKYFNEKDKRNNLTYCPSAWRRSGF